MRRFLIYIVKRLLLNPNLVGWGILYILFWGSIGAYLMAPSFIKQIPTAYISKVYQSYVASWYADLVTLSLSALAVSVAFMLFYQTGTLPYLFRYSRLKESTYIVSVYSGTLIAGLAIELSLTGLISVIFSNNGIGITIYPHEFYILIPFILLANLFFISLSTFLVLLTIKFNGMRVQNLISFTPLVLGFLFYSLFTFSEYPKTLDYTSPYLSLILLLYYGYSGNTPPANLQNPQSSASLELVIISSILWVLILTLANIILIRRIYFTNIEESKQL
ncbi:hypothetical protein V6M85_07565 [Sulfolobus tengchongensis]|uniref:ABC transporter permease n=1 Tax=Sulfolobus tengchongensis TaxID=207809 RepID=A0AAX4KWW5_9CREN